ncbi:MAG: protoporphyrinogen oxidase HemJ [Gammaproteobacteria bacterium]|nr:protoporphyrinogen oxidase HemJ [Gammaproteobacteria bacterium]
MLWLKAFHIIALVAWFSGLFYLPRLFVYHCEISSDFNNNDNTENYNRFCTMERKLYYYITTPAAVITTSLGLVLLYNYLTLELLSFSTAGWLHAKLSLVLFLWGYHSYCGVLVTKFKKRKNTFPSKFYRYFNEIPTFFLVSIVILTTVKPF